MSLPKGLDTWIGRAGIEISGGQRQRLTIARLYLKNPSVLIFDEATSSLDSNTERNIIQCLNRIYSSKTIIIIAHRLSTILNADKILLLNNGKVEAFGKHEDLLKNNVIYSELFSSQMTGGEVL
jgi:ABC-type multidrug transport system fused ATPase/permease subunit